MPRAPPTVHHDDDDDDESPPYNAQAEAEGSEYDVDVSEAGGRGEHFGTDVRLGLTDDARHVITHIEIPRFLS